MTDDDLAELGEIERRGTLVFAAAPDRLVRARTVAFAAMMSAAGLTAWHASRIYAADLGRLPHDHGEAGFIAAVGALLVLLSLRILSFLSHRLADIDATAPLVLRERELAAGAPARSLAYADIGSLAPAPPAGFIAAFVQAIYDRVLRLFGRTATSIVRLTVDGADDDAPPLILDLDLVDGNPRRIQRILDYRIAQYRIAEPKG
jgi:hypothetical protein